MECEPYPFFSLHPQITIPVLAFQHDSKNIFVSDRRNDNAKYCAGISNLSSCMFPKLRFGHCFPDSRKSQINQGVIFDLIITLSLDRFPDSGLAGTHEIRQESAIISWDNFYFF